jgi:hypothetical protein
MLVREITIKPNHRTPRGGACSSDYVANFSIEA